MSETWTTEIQTFVSSDFRHPYASENQTLDSDFRHFTKVSEIQNQKFGFQTHFEKNAWKLNFELAFETVSEIRTVWKPNSFWVSEILTS